MNIFVSLALVTIGILSCAWAQHVAILIDRLEETFPSKGFRRAANRAGLHFMVLFGFLLLGSAGWGWETNHVLWAKMSGLVGAVGLFLIIKIVAAAIVALVVTSVLELIGLLNVLLWPLAPLVYLARKRYR
ncbi:MAG: hypothetical protein PHR51_02675 [Patescibacteria group bacterium]|nr:hypothetical protein [Patescibacteria group bacterium]